MKQYRRAAQALAIVLSAILVAFYWQWLANEKALYLVDISQHWHPFLEYIGHALSHGRFPMWNPYSLCGASQLAVMAPSPCYVFSLLFAWLPFNSALALNLVVNQFVAGLGMFLLVAAADWGVAAALLAGVSYSLCSLLFSLETTCALQATAAWFPLSLWAIFRIEQFSLNKQLAAFVVASLLIYFLIAPGVPEAFAPGLFLILAWCLLLWMRTPVNQGHRTRTLLLRLLAIATGILLAMPELLPIVEWVPLSDRAWGLDTKEVMEWSANWFDLTGFVLPQPLGDQQLVDNQFIGLTSDAVKSVARYITSAYLGPIILTLALVGFFDKTWRSRWLILGVMLLFLCLAMGRNCPATTFLFSVTQFHWLRYPIKLLVFVVLCVFLAAARGISSLQSRISARTVTACVVIWGVMLAGDVILLQPAVLAVVAEPFSKAIGVWPNASREVKTALGLIAQDAIPHLVLGILTCGVIMLLSKKKMRERIAFSLALLTIGAMYLWQAVTLFHHGAPADFYSTQLLLKPPIDRAAAGLNRSGGIRINSLFSHVSPPPDYRYAMNDRTVDYYQFGRQLFCVPSNIDDGFGEPLGIVVGQTAENFRLAAYAYQEYVSRQNDVPLWTYCKMTATDFVVQTESEYRPDGQLIANKQPLSSERFELLDSNKDLKVRTYRVKDALPRAYFASNVKWGAPHESVMRYIAFSEKTGFDPARLVILEHNQIGEQGRHITTASQHSQSEQVQFILDRPEQIKLKVVTARDNYLVLADTFYPGWRATVDSAPIEIFRANAMMRSVFVPKGTHIVEFEYSPDSFKLGLALALVGAMIMIAAAVLAAFMPKQ